MAPVRAQARSENLRLAWLPHIIAGLVLLLALLSTYYFARSAQTNDQLRFENQVEQTQDDITSRLETYVTILRGVSGMFAASGDVDLAQFRAYVERLGIAANYPGVQGVGFSKRLQPDEVAPLEATMRAQYGDIDFHVWPEAPRSEYHSIIYLEPLDRRNQAALGYDMFSEPTRRAAMERARDTGAPTVTDRVTLVQELDANKQAGFLVYVPVYRGGSIPTTLEERRAALIGFAYSPFRAHDLFTGIFGTQTQPRVAFQLYDSETTSPDNLLYQSHPGVAASAHKPHFTTTRMLSFAGHEWTVLYTSQAAFEEPNARYTLLFILLMGIATSIVLFFVLRSQVRARAEAEAAVRVRDIFLSIASHELKTPLTTLYGNAQLLLRRLRRAGALSERDERSLRTIVNQTRRLNSLIVALLDHSRLQSGSLSLERTPVDVIQLVQQAAHEFQAGLTNHVVDIRAPERPVLVSGDALRLDQVLQNLISNAIKYSPEGGAVTIEIDQQDGWATIRITDTGIGIPADALPQLFNQFYRAPNATTQQIGGLGIGLYISQEIVKRHGGDITVSSVEGQGSTFTVRLPLLDQAAAKQMVATMA